MYIPCCLVLALEEDSLQIFQCSGYPNTEVKVCAGRGIRKLSHGTFKCNVERELQGIVLTFKPVSVFPAKILSRGNLMKSLLELAENSLLGK